ncbi:hypothetical protein E2C01_081804 [Portunus trituberculatus]|uniref:Uncharacterized protein n=1 Tax=Portunus trituberculatus TaxID=210409 RepID=A0A5B7IXF8_PORTR|nr:hypothetical protein [Portunus trituberculatus]
MAPKRLISDENMKSGESASVSEPQHSTSGFTGITLETLQRHFHGWLLILQRPPSSYPPFSLLF